jgi:hypothetical protein
MADGIFYAYLPFIQSLRRTEDAAYLRVRLEEGQEYGDTLDDGSLNLRAKELPMLPVPIMNTSPATSVVVAASALSLNPSGGQSQTQTVTAGGAAVFYLRCRAEHRHGIPGTVTFSVSGLPTGVFAPATITAGAGAQTVTMTVQTAAGTASNLAPSTGRRIAPVVLAFLFLPLFGAGRLRRNGRNIGRLLCLLLLLCRNPAEVAI